MNMTNLTLEEIAEIREIMLDGAKPDEVEKIFSYIEKICYMAGIIDYYDKESAKRIISRNN